MAKKKANPDVEAMKAAKSDMGKTVNFTKEDHLEDYTDTVNSTKDSVFYTSGDGAAESAWKKLLRTLGLLD